MESTGEPRSACQSRGASRANLFAPAVTRTVISPEGWRFSGEDCAGVPLGRSMARPAVVSLMTSRRVGSLCDTSLNKV